MRARLFGSQNSVLHLLPHHSMIFGELGEVGVAQKIEPAVPHVGRHKAAADYRACGEGRSHSPEFGNCRGLGVDLQIRFLHGAFKPLRDSPIAGSAFHLVGQNLEGQSAGYLACVMAPESVRYGKEDPILMRPAANCIFIAVADTTGIGDMKKIDLRHKRAPRLVLDAPGAALFNGHYSDYYCCPVALSKVISTRVAARQSRLFLCANLR